MASHPVLRAAQQPVAIDPRGFTLRGVTFIPWNAVAPPERLDAPERCRPRRWEAPAKAPPSSGRRCAEHDADQQLFCRH